MSEKVFVNRILNMKKIKFIGLDMDHTLIRYHTKNFETLVYKLVVEELILRKHYPPQIRNFIFNFESAIRGLIIDSKNGNILKLSRFGAIRQSYHGSKLISYEEQKKIYRSVYVDLKDANYMAIDTSFSIAFCALYAQMVDLKDENPTLLPRYADIARDVLSCVDKVHADGSLKTIITASLENYVIKDKAVVEGLKRYIHYGKKIFILTNSDYFYTKTLLDYAITPFLEKGETWQTFFTYIITLASKPKFFYDTPNFLGINPKDGSMSNVFRKIQPGIYQGGCARKFTTDLMLDGEDILYIGDHIYGDILRLKKDCNWRTALVVEELGEEIAAQKRALKIEKLIDEAMEEKKLLEHKYIELCTKRIESLHDETSEIKYLQQEIVKIDSNIAILIKQHQDFFNERWGRVFRAGAEESYFAFQVERFACIYMEKLADLLAYSPLTYFRSNRRLLAHDLE